MAARRYVMRRRKGRAGAVPARPTVTTSGSGVDLDDLRALGGALHRLAALERRRLRLVRLTGGDDLAVGRLQSEPVLARPVLVHLELARHAWSPSLSVTLATRKVVEAAAGPRRRAAPGRGMGLSLRRDACEGGRDDPVHLLLRGRVVGAREQHVRAADQGQRERVDVGARREAAELALRRE